MLQVTGIWSINENKQLMIMGNDFKHAWRRKYNKQAR